ncbi:MAG: hypothetical protein Q8P52_00935 [bacterium]|nr:hypothetical protein [bacterium]
MKAHTTSLNPAVHSQKNQIVTELKKLLDFKMALSKVFGEINIVNSVARLYRLHKEEVATHKALAERLSEENAKLRLTVEKLLKERDALFQMIQSELYKNEKQSGTHQGSNMISLKARFEHLIETGIYESLYLREER